jgi:hypothetical protein
MILCPIDKGNSGGYWLHSFAHGSLWISSTVDLLCLFEYIDNSQFASRFHGLPADTGIPNPRPWVAAGRHRKSCSSAVEARRHGCYGFRELHGSNGVPAAAKQINSWTRNASTAEHRIYSAPRLSSTCISDARTRPATSNSSRTRPVAVERRHDGDVYSTNPNMPWPTAAAPMASTTSAPTHGHQSDTQSLKKQKKLSD